MRLTTFALYSSGTTDEVTTITTTTSRCEPCTIRIKYYFSRWAVVPRKRRPPPPPPPPAAQRTAINSFSVYTPNRVNGRRSLISCPCPFPGIILWLLLLLQSASWASAERPFVRACVRASDSSTGPVCPYRAEYAAATYFHHRRDRTLSPRYAFFFYYYNRRRPVSYSARPTSLGWRGFSCICALCRRSPVPRISKSLSPRNRYGMHTFYDQKPAGPRSYYVLITAVYFFTVIVIYARERFFRGNLKKK